ncbi:MAG TPA: hypothetical protein VG675_04845 [Bryobacteraceae bacterium]|nr:hypothetical protein [Bryobacteraceae bacterium]
MDAAQLQRSKFGLLFAAALLAAAPLSAQQFSISTDTITLSSDQAQNINVNSTGAAITFSVAKSGTFFNATVNQNTTPAILSIQLTSAPTGPVSGSITLTDNANVAPPVGISVNFVPGGGGPGGALSISPAALSMSAAVGATAQATLTVQATSGQVSFAATPQSSTGWLTITNISSTTTPATITVQANAAGLLSTNYSGTIQIQPVGAAQVNVPVTFVVGGGGGGTGTLTPGTSNLTLTYTTGGNAPVQVVTLTSTSGATTYNASASSVGNWLLVNGQQQVFAQQISQGVSISANPISLNTGSYVGQVSITASDGATAVIQVTLSVNGGSSGDNGITINPATLSFSTLTANQPPAVQQVVVTANQTGVGFNASVTSDRNWLTVSLIALTSTSATYSVGAYTANLSQGTYNGTLTITTTGAIASTESVPVTLSIGTSGGGGSVTGIAPSTLTFSYQTGTSPLVTPQVITIAAGQGTTFSASAAVNNGANWLFVNPVEGNSPGTVTVSVAPQTLTAGLYSGAVTITTATGAQQVSVNLMVTGNPTLLWSPGTINLSYNNGVLTDPRGNVVTNPVGVALTSSDDSTPLDFTATTSTTWLSVSPASGTSPASIAITVNAVGLTAGLYSGTVTVGSTTSSNGTFSIPVVLLVGGGSGGGGPLTLPSSITLNSVTAPSSTVTVGAAASTQFTASASTASGGAWLAVSPTSGTAPTSVTVTATAGSLQNGTYNGTITFIANGITQTVPVAFTVGSGGPSLTASPTSLSFSYQAGGQSPPVQGLVVSSASGSAPVTFGITTSTDDGGSWLKVNTATSATPVTLSVSVDPTGLSGGTYHGTVTLTPTGGGTPLAVQVTFAVQGAPVVTASPTSLTFNYRAGDNNPAAQTVQVSSGGTSLAFTAQASSSGWLSVAPGTGTAPLNISVSVDPTNLKAGTYSGTITVSPTGTSTGASVVNVTLTVTVPLPTITRVVNAASFQTTPLSPGEIITIGGTNIGPSNAAFLTLDQSGKVSTQIGGVQVLVNGFAAPMIYASSTQVSAVVPYEAAGLQSPYVQIKYLGQSSNTYPLAAAATAPGVFTFNSSGSGPGAILNSDNSVNSPTNPAAKGSIVVLYLTGEGQTNPAGVTGKVTDGSNIQNIPVPLLKVGVLVDGQPADYTFAGEAPGLVSGVMQLNVILPTNVRSGDVPVQVSIGGNISQTGVTVSVK